MKNRLHSLTYLGFALCFFGAASCISAAQGDLFIGVYGGTSTLHGEGISLDVGDFDNDGVVQNYSERLPTNGTAKLFYLRYRPVHTFEGVTVDGVPLPPSDTISGQSNYAYHPQRGWVTLRQAYGAAKQVLVRYRYSTDIDIAVSNGLNSEKNNSIYFNEGNFTFNEALGTWGQNTAGYGQIYDVAAADYDNDGDIDLLTSNKPFLGSSSFVGKIGTFSNYQVLRNTGAGFLNVSPNNTTVSMGGIFAMIAQVMNENIPTSEALWMDYDNDGDLDAFLGWQNPDNDSRPYSFEILRNEFGLLNDGISEQSIAANGQIQGVAAADAGDYDNDGDLDLILTHENHDTRLFNNQVSGGPFVYMVGSPYLVQHIPAGGFIAKYIPDPLKQVAMIKSNFLTTLNRPLGMAVTDAYYYVLSMKTPLRVITCKGLGGYPYLEVLRYRKLDWVLDRFVNQVNNEEIPLFRVYPPLVNRTAWGIAVDQDHVYVTDPIGNRILVFDRDLVWQQSLDGVEYPVDVAVDNEYLYVAYNDNDLTVPPITPNPDPPDPFPLPAPPAVPPVPGAVQLLPGEPVPPGWELVPPNNPPGPGFPGLGGGGGGPLGGGGAGCVNVNLPVYEKVGKIRVYNKTDWSFIDHDHYTNSAGVNVPFGQDDVGGFVVNGITVDQSSLTITANRPGPLAVLIRVPKDFNGRGMEITSWGDDPDQFKTLRGVDVDAHYVYVADFENKRIQKRNKHDFDFVSVNSLNIDPYFQPFDVAVDHFDSRSEHYFMATNFNHKGPYSSIAWVDWNQDGRLDYIQAGDDFAGKNIHIGINDGTANFFANGPSFDEDNIGFSSVEVADLDGNKKADVLLNRKIDGNNAGVIKVSTHSNFTPLWDSSGLSDDYDVVQGNKIALADFNNDGLLDLAKSSKGVYRNVTVFKNNFKKQLTKKTRITISTGEGKYPVKLIQEYLTNPDLSAGPLFRHEVR